MKQTDSQWSIETIYSLITSNRLSYNTNPKWCDRKQQLFIESVYLGLPVPMLVLQSQNNLLSCVDGNQRLIALVNHKRKVIDNSDIDTLCYEHQLDAQSMRVVVLYNASGEQIDSIRQRLNC